MSNDDPFADLDDMAGDESPDEDDEPVMEDQGSNSGGEYPEPDPEPEPEAVDPREEPAFPFDDALQRPLYAREDSWDDFEDACDFEVRRLLRDDDVKGVEGRELHEATLRLAAENPELLADEVRKLRGIDDTA